MAIIALVFALASLPLPAMALPAGITVATLGEKASAFETLAECEEALGPLDSQGRTPLAAQDGLRGSQFNRAAGNTSRCEIVDGEPLIIVTPKSF